MLEIRTSEDIVANFNRMANELFNNYLIQVNDNLYRIIEIEFYYDNLLSHNDSSTHGHELQKRSGFWYAHASGIDLTFGDSTAAGGILIRSIVKIPTKNDDGKKYTFGPRKVKTELLSGFNHVISGVANEFKLVPAEGKYDKVTKKDIVQCQRVGLEKKKNLDIVYLSKPYRYLIFPEVNPTERTSIAEGMYEQSAKDIAALDRIKKVMKSELLNRYR